MRSRFLNRIWNRCLECNPFRDDTFDSSRTNVARRNVAIEPSRSNECSQKRQRHIERNKKMKEVST